MYICTKVIELKKLTIQIVLKKKSLIAVSGDMFKYDATQPVSHE